MYIKKKGTERGRESMISHTLGNSALARAQAWLLCSVFKRLQRMGARCTSSCLFKLSV
jgi:hypothetical protein